MSLYSQIDATLDPSPEDWIAARVHRLLSYDVKLNSILPSRIFLTRSPEDIDYTVTEGPVLHVAPHLSGEPVGYPGHQENRPVEVVVSLMWQEVEWEPVHPSVHPSPDSTTPGLGMGTVLNYVWYLVDHPENREMWEPHPTTGEPVQLVSPGHTSRSVQDMTPFPKTENGPLVFGIALLLRFEVKVDIRTGKIRTLI